MRKSHRQLVTVNRICYRKSAYRWWAITWTGSDGCRLNEEKEKVSKGKMRRIQDNSLLSCYDIEKRTVTGASVGKGYKLRGKRCCTKLSDDMILVLKVTYGWVWGRRLAWT